MKPIIIYPSREDEDTITIKKSYFESIIEQVYQQGVSDGNVIYNKPVYRETSTTPPTDKVVGDVSTYGVNYRELLKGSKEKGVQELLDKCDLYEARNGKAYTL